MMGNSHSARPHADSGGRPPDAHASQKSAVEAAARLTARSQRSNAKLPEQAISDDPAKEASHSDLAIRCHLFQ